MIADAITGVWHFTIGEHPSFMASMDKHAGMKWQASNEYIKPPLLIPMRARSPFS